MRMKVIKHGTPLDHKMKKLFEAGAHVRLRMLVSTQQRVRRGRRDVGLRWAADSDDAGAVGGRGGAGRRRRCRHGTGAGPNVADEASLHRLGPARHRRPGAPGRSDAGPLRRWLGRFQSGLHHRLDGRWSHEHRPAKGQGARVAQLGPGPRRHRHAADRRRISHQTLNTTICWLIQMSTLARERSFSLVIPRHLSWGRLAQIGRPILDKEQILCDCGIVLKLLIKWKNCEIKFKGKKS